MMRTAALDSRIPAARQTALSRSVLLPLAALTPAVLLIHGYHPYADDAGIYVAGIRKLLHPALYQIDAPFVVPNTHLSVFAHIVAGSVRVTHLPLTVALLIAYLASIYLFLLGSWLVASRLFSGTWERWFAVALAAACFTLPAAATALTLMDPYVTSRSFSTPLALFAVAAVLERRWGLTSLLIVLMALMHPLMTMYAAALVLLYAVADAGYPRAAVALSALGIAAVALIALATRHAPVIPAYAEAMHSSARSFLYPAQWKWYEDLGLALPVALLALAWWRSRRGGRVHRLCFACLLLGSASIIAAFSFVHSSGPYLLVRVQLLRTFHVIYLIGVVLLGGWLGGALWKRHNTRWLAAALLAAIAVGLLAAQRATYPMSAHIEWPGMAPRNPWQQAYVWIRGNTPKDAVFAADPHLVFRDGVDEQGFRATTERSLLADDKDQGVAAVVDPAIAPEWAEQRDAQVGIDTMSDTEREQHLRPFRATWLLLRADSATGFACPYRNAVAKVCRME